MKTGKTTTTYRLKLYNRHYEYFLETKDLYNQVLEFYYLILAEHEEWLELSNHFLMRELEIQTVGTREQKKAAKETAYPIRGFPKLPLYFRRAAINAAIGMMRSFVKRREQWEEKQKSGGQRQGHPSHASGFHAAPVYYKGMYRKFEESSVELKLFNGKSWEWKRFLYSGRKFPENSRILSPVLKIEGQQVFLCVPVQVEVEDVRTIKERLMEHAKIMAVAFPGSDCMAAAAVFSSNGSFQKSKCFFGGNQMKAYRDKALKRLSKSIKSRATMSEKNKEESGSDSVASIQNHRIYEKIEHINEYYSNQISKKIVEFCRETGCTIIVVPNYEKAIDFTKRRYLKSNEFEWLGRSIIRQIKYKAFKQGIVTSTIRPYHITDQCSRCGTKIKKYNEGHRPRYHYYGGRLFLCPNGHQGNAAINAAKNIGYRFFKTYNLDEL